MSVVVVRPGQWADLAAIVRLDAGTPEIAHWPEAEYAAILSSDGGESLPALTRRIFIAESEFQDGDAGHSICGFVLVKCLELPGAAVAEIENLAVDARIRRRGVGRALMQRAIDWSRGNKAARLQLEVRASNLAAIALYRGLQFAVAGNRPRYYSHPIEDAVLLDLELS